MSLARITVKKILILRSNIKRKVKQFKLWFGYALSDKITGIDSNIDYTQDASVMNKDNNPYQPIHAVQMKKIMDALSISPIDKLFDYGCGKGAAMVFFSKYPFAKIGGIELMEELCKISNKNFKKKGLPHLIATTGDATLYTDIDEYNYFYFYNPFRGSVMEKVIAQINESIIRTPRDIVILYQNPEDAEIFEKTKIFSYQKKCFIPRIFNNKRLGRQFINIYATNTPTMRKSIEAYFI